MPRPVDEHHTNRKENYTWYVAELVRFLYGDSCMRSTTWPAGGESGDKASCAPPADGGVCCCGVCDELLSVETLVEPTLFVLELEAMLLQLPRTRPAASVPLQFSSGFSKHGTQTR